MIPRSSTPRCEWDCRTTCRLHDGKEEFCLRYLSSWLLFGWSDRFHMLLYQALDFAHRFHLLPGQGLKLIHCLVSKNLQAIVSSSLTGQLDFIYALDFSHRFHLLLSQAHVLVTGRVLLTDMWGVGSWNISRKPAGSLSLSLFVFTWFTQAPPPPHWGGITL